MVSKKYIFFDHWNPLKNGDKNGDKSHNNKKKGFVTNNSKYQHIVSSLGVNSHPWGSIPMLVEDLISP
jgi:hypothetical protein